MGVTMSITPRTMRASDIVVLALYELFCPDFEWYLTNEVIKGTIPFPEKDLEDVTELPSAVRVLDQLQLEYQIAINTFGNLRNWLLSNSLSDDEDSEIRLVYELFNQTKYYEDRKQSIVEAVIVMKMVINRRIAYMQALDIYQTEMENQIENHMINGGIIMDIPRPIHGKEYPLFLIWLSLDSIFRRYPALEYIVTPIHGGGYKLSNTKASGIFKYNWEKYATRISKDGTVYFKNKEQVIKAFENLK